MLTGPVVTDADREWAIQQCPAWMSREADYDLPEIVDDDAWLEISPASKTHKPSAIDFVAEQAESFERYFAGQRKSYEDWSRIWRGTWWSNADPVIRFPKSAPKSNEVVHPVFRAGTEEFDAAIAVATTAESRLWKKIGVACIHKDDPRLAKIASGIEAAA